MRERRAHTRAGDAHRGEVAREVREFIVEFDRLRANAGTVEPFAPVTINFVARVRPIVEQLAAIEARDGS